MKSVLSATENDLYAFPLPITVWSWFKIGIKSIVLIPESKGKKLELAKKYCDGMAEFYTFTCEERKEATFAQTSRLFASTVCEDKDEVLITGDADLAVFGIEFEKFNDGWVRVLGADLLTPDMKQYPMCFIGMPAYKWKEVFGSNGDTLQQALDSTVGQLISENFRGDHWGYDQWYAYKKITESNEPLIKINRAKYPERFAKHRYDRDDAYLLDRLNLDTIDFHLPRPGYEEKNFDIILKVFKYHYPSEDFQWMIDYRDEYLKLIK